MGSCGIAVTTGSALDNLAFPMGALAAVSLPPSLFSTITDRTSDDNVGIFFTFYEDSTLFPLRRIVRTDNSTLRPVIASGIVGATVGPGLEFVDLDPTARVEIILRTIDVVANTVSIASV